MAHSMARPYQKDALDLLREGMARTKGRDRPQTFQEETYNVLTHGIGAVLAAVGTAALLVRSALAGSVLAFVSAVLYSASLLFLYSASTIYHAAGVPERKRQLRIWDHCSIFLLILGTYIPISLMVIGGWLGWTLCAVNTALAAAGIISRVVTMSHGKSHLSVALYLVMGWLVVLAIRPVVRLLPPVGLLLLVAGGVAYTVGIYFYKKNGPYMHVIWHLFVLAGSALHYACVFLCCCG